MDNSGAEYMTLTRTALVNAKIELNHMLHTSAGVSRPTIVEKETLHMDRNLLDPDQRIEGQ